MHHYGYKSRFSYTKMNVLKDTNIETLLRHAERQNLKSYTLHHKLV